MKILQKCKFGDLLCVVNIGRWFCAVKLTDTLNPVINSLWVALGSADATDTLLYRNDRYHVYLKCQFDKNINFLVITVSSGGPFKMGTCV